MDGNHRQDATHPQILGLVGTVSPSRFEREVLALRMSPTHHRAHCSSGRFQSWSPYLVFCCHLSLDVHVLNVIPYEADNQPLGATFVGVLTVVETTPLLRGV